MSAPYRQQIELVLPEIQEVLAAQRDFPVPVQNAQSDTVFHALIRQMLTELDMELTDANEFLEQLTTIHNQWMSLRTSMTGNERTADNDLYTQFTAAHAYLQSQAQLKTYVRKLRNQQKSLKAKLPAPNANPPAPNANSSLAHLPRMELPTFQGKCVEFPSFWSQFKAAVGDIANIPDSVKLSYLKNCLKDAPLSLIAALPLTDDSYQAAVNLLMAKYNNATEITRSLHQSLKNLPTVRGGEHFCADLTKLVDSLEGLCLRFGEQGEDANALHVQLEVENKLPVFVLEEVYKAKEEIDDGEEWTTEDLRDKLKAILKRKEEINAIRPYQPAKPKQSTHPPKRPNDQSSSSAPPSSPNSSLTFHANAKASDNRPKPKLPCVFCDKPDHFSSSCRQYADHNSRSARIKELKRCFKCIKSGHFAPQCPQPSKCKNCSGAHPWALCPNYQPRQGQRSQTSTNFAQNSAAPTPTPSLFSNTPMPTFHPYFYPTMTPTPSISHPPYGTSSHPPPGANPDTQAADSHRQSNVASAEVNGNRVLLKCVRGNIFNPNNPSQACCGIILLDDASTHSYILTREAQNIGLPLTASTINLGVFNSPQTKKTQSFSTSFGLVLANGRSIIIKANTLDKLTQPTNYLPFTPELLSVTDLVANPSQLQSVSPIILLGADFYYDLEPTPIKKLPTGYHLIQTLLGPIVAGKPFLPFPSPPTHQTNFCLQVAPPAPPPDFFTLEGIGITDTAPSLKDDEVYQQFMSNIELVEEGSEFRYQVKLPFKSEPSSLPLPSNFGLAYGRLRSVVNGLQKTPYLLQKYHEIIQEQLKLSIIEPVNNPDVFSPPLHYVPHHAIFRPEKNKIRVVYDGSARVGRSMSLNDCLHTGPVILADLVGLLIRFRVPAIAVVCDIERAFLQVRVHPSHRDCTRFVWIKDLSKPVSSSNIQIYRFTSVSFGLGPSPFLLAGTIKHHLSLHPSPLASEIEPNIYVDNVLLSADDAAEGQAKCTAVSSLFSKASMKLREFTSNCPAALTDLPSEDKLPGTIQKFLGVKWDTASDQILIEISPPPSSFVPTKRSTQGFMATQYDPSGFIAPLIVPFKIFLQSLWAENLKWDDPLPPSLASEWDKVIKGWDPKFTISIPRPLSHLPKAGRIYELHAFSDASNLAMCAAVYLRISHPSATAADNSLVFSKTKVKPIPNKKSVNLTIPRLELIAATMGAKALKFVSSHLTNIPLEQAMTLWVDSSAAIGWLNSPIPNRDIFVLNRLNAIRSVPHLAVKHTAGSDNPADLGSRGVASGPALAAADIWWRGPGWLTLEPQFWPFQTSPIKPFISDEFRTKSDESAETPMFAFHSSLEPIVVRVIDPSKFSRLPKLLRVSAFVLRYIARLKMRVQTPRSKRSLLKLTPKSPVPFISLSELRAASRLLIRQEQQILPPPDRDNVSLGLFVDDKQILRSKGRLGKSNLPFGTVHPIYMPPNSPLTPLIIQETHLIYHHASPLSTLAILRRQLWIPHGRRVVERVISQRCLTCRRYSARPFDLPPFPHLPSDRVCPSRPFSAVGVDFCGPLKLRTPVNGKEKGKVVTSKYYVVLWVCLVTRGVSLDIVPDLSAPNFLLAFRRFQAKFGPPASVYSDNAPTLISISKIAQAHFPITWHFRTPMAPWKAGHFERLVQPIKHHLRRALGPGLLPKTYSFDYASTILMEIETIINSRPITFDSANPLEPRPLRPIDFYRPLGHAGPLPIDLTDSEADDPTFSLNSSNSDALELMWKSLSNSAKYFWAKWSMDYLLSLRERAQKLASSKASRPPKAGDLVLVSADSPRSNWPIAVIQKIHLSADNFPDTASIKMINTGNYTTRSVGQLFPLEVECPTDPVPTDPPPSLPTKAPVLQLRSRAVARK